MQEISPPVRRPLQIDQEVIWQLIAPSPAKEVNCVLNAQEREETPLEAAQRIGAAHLQAGRYAEARQHYAQAIQNLQGQVPDVQLMPLLTGHVQACLETNRYLDYSLPGGATQAQLRDALPSLRRLVEISQANAQALDQQRPTIRPRHLMMLAHAQT
ncbi:MAG: hypothetical protein C5B53_00005, partial [Candidatus Melainabacteria bacterium]